MLWAAIVVTRPCPKRLATPLQIFLQHERGLHGERTFVQFLFIVNPVRTAMWVDRGVFSEGAKCMC
jgi:hypothetical protein